MIASGRTRLAGVMGWPVGHSRSPRLHGFWLDHHGIDGAYLPLAVHPDDLGLALKALPALGFRGCNLTVPHKEAALALVDRVDDAAARIGAINTVIIGADGRLEGRNTDGLGFLANLRAGAPGFTAPGATALVLGAGGAARAVIVALVDAGLARVLVANRSPAKAEALAGLFGPVVGAVPWAARGTALAEADLVVNTTSLGMVGQPPLDLSLAGLPAAAVVTDLVYAPLETALLAAARRRGNPVVDGLGMLLHQAVPGFAAWFGVTPEVTAAVRRFVLAAPP